MKSIINTNLIEEYIERENIDETEFCIRAKMSYEDYSKLKNHNYDINVKYIFTIADVLDIKPYQLFIPTLKDLKKLRLD